MRMFGYQVKKAIAGMAAALSGLDRLVFAGGIGENNTALRGDVAAGLSFFGPFEVSVIPSQEALQIARLTDGLLASHAKTA